MKILQEIEVPDFDVTKWTYVPFVMGAAVEAGWMCWDSGVSNWSIVGSTGKHFDSDVHYLKPIAQPVPKSSLPPVPEGWEIVEDPKATGQEGWKWCDILEDWREMTPSFLGMEIVDVNWNKGCRFIRRTIPAPSGYTRVSNERGVLVFVEDEKPERPVAALKAEQEGK